MSLNPHTNPALTTGETAHLKTPCTVFAYLDVIPSSYVLATGQITGVVNRTGYDQVTLLQVSTSSGDFTKAKAGATIWVGSSPGLHDIGVYRLRKDYSAGNLYPMQISGIDAGLLTPISTGAGQVSQFQYATVRGDRNLWQAYSRVDTTVPLSPVFYKDYDKPWGGQTISPRPVVNIGPHRATFYDPGQSYATLSWLPFTNCWAGTDQPYSYTWTLPSGATLISGSSSGTSTLAVGDQSAMAITIQLTSGFWEIDLTVTATPSYGGAPVTTIARRYLWIHDGNPWTISTASYPPNIQVASTASDQRTPIGRSIQMTLNDADLAGITDGVMCLYWEYPIWEGGTVPTATTSCSGWISSVNHQVNDDGTKQAVVTLLNPGLVLQNINAGTDRVDIATTPTTWQQATVALGNPEYMIFYFLSEHMPNALELGDYFPYQNGQVNSYPGVGFSGTAGNELNPLQTLAKMAALEIGCDSSGALWTRPDPSLCPSADRTVQVVIRDTLTADDYGSPEWMRTFFPPLGKLITQGFQATGTIDPATGNSIPTPFRAEAPGVGSGQGIGSEQMVQQIVTASFSLQEIGGNEYAARNRPYPNMKLTFYNNRDVFEPAQWGTAQITIPAQFSPTGVQIGPAPSNQYGLWVPIQVNKTLGLDGTATLEVEFEYQTQGGSATLVAIPPPVLVTGGGTGLTPPPPPPPPPPPSGTYTHTWDFGGGAQGFTINPSSGPGSVYADGAGFTTVINPGGPVTQNLYIDVGGSTISLASGSTIATAEVDILSNMTTFSPSGHMNVHVTIGTTGLPVSAGGSAVVNTGVGTFQTPAGTVSGSLSSPSTFWTPNPTNGPCTVTQLTVQVDFNEFVVPTTHPIVVTRLVITGTGTDPFKDNGGTTGP